LRSLLSSQQGFEIVGEAKDGLEATRKIKGKRFETKIRAFTVRDCPEYMTASLMAGADGYLLKSIPRSELIQSIEDTVSGEKILNFSQ
jgi:DNA-binding NarL/FixJ family response regulator